MTWWRRGVRATTPSAADDEPEPPAGIDRAGRFVDRVAAGSILAEIVADRLDRSRPDPLVPDQLARTVVLAIPRGGVPVAAVIAGRLAAPLDVLVAHKIGAPGQPELAIGAVAADGTVRREEWAADYIADAAFDRAAAAEVARAAQREEELRAGRPAAGLDGATVVLVDDGVATGATMLVAVASARRSGAGRVVVATPVASNEAIGAMEHVADAVVVARVPHDLQAVGQWYVRFDQVADAEVRAILAGMKPGH